MFNYFKKAVTAAIIEQNQPIFLLHLKHVGQDTVDLPLHFSLPFDKFRFSCKENFLQEKIFKKKLVALSRAIFIR